MDDRPSSNQRSSHLFGDLKNTNAKHTFLITDEKQVEKDNEEKFGNGLLGRISKHVRFEQSTVVVVIFNALVIGWDADYSARWYRPENLYEGPVAFAFFEVFFCAFFTLEILIRFLGFRKKLRCFTDRWFVFDSALVALMLFETFVLPFLHSAGPFGQLSVLRLVRLVRITRLVKLMKAFPQLMIIIKGISAAIRAVVWSAVLIVIFTYSWSIVLTSEFHQGSKTDAEVQEQGIAIEEFFGSIGKSMLSLVVMGTILDDVTAACDAIRGTGNGLMLFCFLLYVLVNSFTMLNMLTGILVEVVGNTAEAEKSNSAETAVRDSIKKLFDSIDQDGSGHISRAELLKMKDNRSAMRALQELDVSDKHFDMYVELLFAATSEDRCSTLSFDELLECILRLRPGASVNSLDFACFRQRILDCQTALGKRMNKVENLCMNLLVDGGLGESPKHSFAAVPSSPSSDDAQEFWALPMPPAQREPHLAVTAGLLARLQRTASGDIVGELQRRFGLMRLETGVPLSMLDADLGSSIGFQLSELR